jgi:hypothetical protein
MTTATMTKYMTAAESLARANAAHEAFTAINGSIRQAEADPLYSFIRDAMHAAISNWESMLDEIGPELSGKMREMFSEKLEALGL